MRTVTMPPCLGAPPPPHLYDVLSLICARGIHRKEEEKEGEMEKGGKKKKKRVEEKEERASREWRMNYSTGSSHLPRR